METLVKIIDACEKTNTLCQLQEGSLLGAVKLENILPWERDCDISVLSSQFNNLTQYLEKNPIGKLKISIKKMFSFQIVFCFVININFKVSQYTILVKDL